MLLEQNSAVDHPEFEAGSLVKKVLHVPKNPLDKTTGKTLNLNRALQ